MKSLFQLNLPKDIQASADIIAKPTADWSGAVVFLFVGDRVLLIKRSETMPSHQGQIAFVGGHRMAGETPWETARREFEEETGFSSEKLRLAGFLEEVETSSRAKILPAVCSWAGEPEEFIKKVRSNGEWSEAMLLPFERLLLRENWSFAQSIWRDTHHLIKFFPIMRGTYLSSSGDNDKDHLLWGATANMIWNFFKFYEDDVK